MRTALDAGRPGDAITALNRELHVASGDALPKKMESDDALLVLDRASIHQAVASFASSKRDYQAADKALDILDLSHGTADDIGRWAFSDSTGRYVAPPHEKLLVNVMNMLNYLETRDLSGACVEARRLVVSSRWLRDRDREEDPSLAIGSIFAGFAFEKSGQSEEARRFYDDASRIRPGLSAAFAPDMPEDAGEILVVIGDGRVPHRIAEHVPIGLALTRAAPFLSGGDRAKASSLAAQGLVTWVNFPTLAQQLPPSTPPIATVDGKAVALEVGLDVAGLVRTQWSKIEGQVMAAALTRAIARVLAGKAIEAATSTSRKDGVKVAGLLGSLILQAALSAADTPDTRSWETLPARLSLARVVVPAGDHAVVLAARGSRREGRIHVAPGGWAATSLMALR